jgi:hypothetical protein
MNKKYYRIAQALSRPGMQGLWEGSVWREISPLAVDFFRPEGSGHRPKTLCKLTYDERSIYGIFRVEDHYVRSVQTEFQSDVWKDSCVEIFIQPEESLGYFNFEFNCAGALLASYVTDPARKNGHVKAFTPLTAEDDGRILRYTGLPSLIDPERVGPFIWHLEFAIPFGILETYAGALGKIKGRNWRGNFYKCGNETSHPHWASWSPLSDRNFHDPESFGNLVFAV